MNQSAEMRTICRYDKDMLSECFSSSTKFPSQTNGRMRTICNDKVRAFYASMNIMFVHILRRTIHQPDEIEQFYIW